MKDSPPITPPLLGYAIAFVGREVDTNQPPVDPPMRRDTIDWIEFEQVDGKWSFLSYRHLLHDATRFETWEKAMAAIREANVNDYHGKNREFDHACSYIIPIQPPMSDRDFYVF